MYKKIFLSMLILFSLSACSGTQTLTAEDSGKSIQIKTGETFTITLESNPTTGYQWMVLDVDEKILSQVGDAEYQSKGTVMPGSGGEETFTFKALKSGKTELLLGYERPWEEGVDPVESFTITVIVE